MGVLHILHSALLLLLVFASQLQFSAQISNGAPATEGEFPFMVQLLISVQVNGTHAAYANCGGSILSPDVVLTAAHCVQPHAEGHAETHGGPDVHVIAGDLWRRKGPRRSESEHEHESSQVSSVSRILIHPKYKHAHSQELALLSPYDLALMFLDRQLVFNEYVQPVQVAKYGQMLRAGATLQICGWGYETEHHHPFLLRKARLAFDHEQGHCFERLYSRAARLLGDNANFDLMPQAEAGAEEGEVSTICVGDLHGSNVCRGDSGGPLVCTVNETKFVCGVASWALGGQCGVNGAPAVFTDVGQFQEWIFEQTGIGSEPMHEIPSNGQTQVCLHLCWTLWSVFVGLLFVARFLRLIK